jgi:hypothetical protein
MREIRLSGSVEGVVSNHDPYSDHSGRLDRRRWLSIPMQNCAIEMYLAHIARFAGSIQAHYWHSLVKPDLLGKVLRPLSRFSVADIRQEVLDQGLVAQISGATIWRWLSKDALRPWRHRRWIFPRDPYVC